ncbi:MAG: hypothetical protein PHV60_07935 [bacterium]|nr:hypothetical protein [bacterium]
MKLISSKGNTFFNKRIFPVFWFGFIGIFFFTALFNPKEKTPFPFIIMPIIMGVFGYFIMKHLIFDLMDEVWDRGDVLIVRNNKEEEIIPLSNIMNISATTFTNPPRVTLMLRQPCRFGKEVTFSPPLKLFQFKSPIVSELIERVDRARK